MPHLHKSDICSKILDNKRKKIAVLIDPDKHSEESLSRLVQESVNANIDFFMTGGSLLLNPINRAINIIRENTRIPVVLFPGNLLQLSDKVDAMMLLSLISGRNAELLIGNHVVAAPFIRNSGIATLSVGYMLIGTGKSTSVEYMSNTTPIPPEKTDIAVATAMAGELLGLKLIYLEAGSGADKPVPEKMIEQVKRNIHIPLIVGGGLRSGTQIENACTSGADIIVIGNFLEKNAGQITKFAEIVHGF